MFKLLKIYSAWLIRMCSYCFTGKLDLAECISPVFFPSKYILRTSSKISVVATLNSDGPFQETCTSLDNVEGRIEALSLQPC